MSDITFLKDFLTPVDSTVLTANANLSPYQLGNTVQIYNGNELPDLDGVRIAIIGVSEQRQSVNNMGTADAAVKVKQELYQLSAFNDACKIVDLGLIKQGASPKDTYFGLGKVCNTLLKLNIIPIVIGGSNDLAYGQFLGYENMEQQINYVHADSRLDMSFLQEEILANTFLSNIFTHKPNFLNQFSLLGYQSYLVDYNLLKVLEQMNFEAVRLGALQEDYKEMEPYVRDADMVSIDISAVRASEAPGNGNSSPNGFFGNQICALARYAGMSDKVSSFGVYEVNPHLDLRNQTAQLAAQMIWYFMDGVISRVADYPVISENDFMKYAVHLQGENQDMLFLKSKKSSRWWMKVPGSKAGQHKLVPCSYLDYEKAVQEELPDRWVNAMM